MFTAKQKEKICQEIYDWTTSPYLTATWKALDAEVKQRILSKMEPYLNKPENEPVLKRILLKFDAEAIEEFEKTLPYPLATDWERAEAELHPKPMHMVVSDDKTSVSFYTDAEWAEYQKTLKE